MNLQIASGLAYWICFCFGHPRREAGARRVLAHKPPCRSQETIRSPIRSAYDHSFVRVADTLGTITPVRAQW
ncbi:MAG: hypothetical protein ACRDY3_11540 [Acidimicrobiales bacterium]